MEISLILDVSAQLATRVLARLEQCPEIGDLQELLDAINRPDPELEDVIVHALGWDDAVLQVEQRGAVSPAEARKVVDWVVLHMALEDWLASAGHDRALAEWASVAGISADEARARGAAETFQTIVRNTDTDRAAVTRAFAVAAQLDFADAFALADALKTEGSSAPVVAAAEWADKGDAEESAASLASGLGIRSDIAAAVGDALVRAFARG